MYDTIHIDPYEKKAQSHEKGLDSYRRRVRKRLQTEFHRIKTESTCLHVLLYLLIALIGFIGIFMLLRHFALLKSRNSHPVLEFLDRKVSIVVPTYGENENLEPLCKRVFESLKGADIEGELLIVDDNSDDGTVETVQKLQDEGYNISVIVRKVEKGLSSAVITGFRNAQNDILLVMDADLSHPPNALPNIIEPLVGGKADFVLASRYMEGGGTSGWPMTRRIVSWGATVLAAPLVSVSDPMSGFFALKRSLFVGAASKLNPSGFKIGLEIIVRSQPVHIHEVPFIFIDRAVGQSKLKLKTQVLYVLQLFRLMWFMYPFLFIILFLIFGGVVATSPLCRRKDTSRFT